MRQRNPTTGDIENPSTGRKITGKELKSEEEFSKKKGKVKICLKNFFTARILHT